MAAKEVWQEFEGRALDRGIVVGKCLAVSDHSADFAAEYGAPPPEKVAVKLISVNAAAAARQLARVEAAARLSHPGLIRILGCGLWPVEEPRVLYVLTEYAPENLAEVVAQRALTPAEVQEALGTALDALAYLHLHGCVHGHLTPSNIMAVDDRVKISSDGLMRIGDAPAIASTDLYHPPEAWRGSVAPAWDVWALGVTMVQVLTQQPPAWERSEPRKLLVPAALPEPFREVARNCLQDDPQRRWTVERIRARLASGASSQPAPQPAASGMEWNARRYVIPAAGVGAALVGFLVLLSLRHPPPAAPVPVTARQTAPAGKAAVEKARPAPFESSAAPQEPGATAAPEAPAAKGAGAAPPAPPGKPEARNARESIVRRVMPNVPAEARNTIQGTVRVAVEVKVDAKGNVKKASLESRGPSRYFANLAVAAARAWKFTPASPDGDDPLRSWILRFDFRRSGTQVRAAPGRGKAR